MTLAPIFEMLTDKELLSRFASGDLTKSATLVALTEITSRGLIPPSRIVDDVPPDEIYLGDMVILERGLSATDAHILCSLLRSVGFHADAGDTNIVQTNAFLTIAVGGANIRVPTSQVEEARAVISSYRAGEFDLGDDFQGNEAGRT